MSIHVAGRIRVIDRGRSRTGRQARHADVGLDGGECATDIRELRRLLEIFNTAKQTAWQTLMRIVTTGFILALVAGVLIKLKLFGVGH